MEEKDLKSVKNGDKVAFEKLLLEFDPLIKREVSLSMRNSGDALGADPEEMRSEAMLALYKAALSYKAGKNVTFGLYAKVCIHNRLVSYMRKQISLFKRRSRQENGSEKSERNPEEYLIALEGNERLKKILANEATEYERKTFELYLQSKSYAEISEVVGRDVKSVGNAIYRIKKKIKTMYMLGN